MMRGLDISNHQQGLVLANLTDRPDFVIILATEGTGFVSPTWADQYEQAKSLGLLVGLYHFARNDTVGTVEDAQAEADYFLDTIGPDVIGEAILILDWERDPKDDVTWARAWLDRVFDRTGVRPLIYMSEWPAQAYDWRPVAVDTPLWVAKYRDNTVDNGWESFATNAGTFPSVTGGGWPGYVIWQWTSKGRLDGWAGDAVKGISPNLDMNVAYLTPEEWKDLATPQGSEEAECVTVEDLIAVVDEATRSLRSSLITLQGAISSHVGSSHEILARDLEQVLVRANNIEAAVSLTQTRILEQLAEVQTRVDQLHAKVDGFVDDDVLIASIVAAVKEVVASPKLATLSVPLVISQEEQT